MQMKPSSSSSPVIILWYLFFLASLSASIYGVLTSKSSSSSTMMSSQVNRLLSTMKTQTSSSLVIAGPSGVGKGTLIQSLLTSFPDKIALSVSQTTRPPRQGEVNGYHYEFISPSLVAGLTDLELKQQFMEYTYVHGNFYGTSKDAMSRIHNQGKLCILDIDSNGVKQMKDIRTTNEMKRTSPGEEEICKFMFIAPPSFEDLERRLRGRGTETEQQIQTRLKNAIKELDYGTEENFDKILVNENVEVTRQECIGMLSLWFPHLELTSRSV
jgi:guanylate kinase